MCRQCGKQGSVLKQKVVQEGGSGLLVPNARSTAFSSILVDEADVLQVLYSSLCRRRCSVSRAVSEIGVHTLSRWTLKRSTTLRRKRQRILQAVWHRHVNGTMWRGLWSIEKPRTFSLVHLSFGGKHSSSSLVQLSTSDVLRAWV